MYGDAHLSYKWYKVQKTLFQWPSKVHKYQITKQLKYAAENKWHGDLFTNGENLTAKTPPGDFQVTTPEIPLLSQQAITSKGIPSTLPTYS